MINLAQSDQLENIKSRASLALEKIRPYLIADGGDIEIVELTHDFILKVKLLGNCESCRMSASTMHAGVAATIKQDVPEIMSVIAVNVS